MSGAEFATSHAHCDGGRYVELDRACAHLPARTRLVLWPSDGQGIGNHKREHFGVVPADKRDDRKWLCCPVRGRRNRNVNRDIDETSGNKRSHENMRQGQHSKKNRGRNRRQSNPGNRVYESNGPDVKIRGNASHVSEKYLALARDAQAAGDPIASENYLQHAEHYLRIIAAAQANQQAQSQPCAPDQVAAGEEEARGNGSAHPRERSRSNGTGRRDKRSDAAEQGADKSVNATSDSDAEEPSEREAAASNGADVETKEPKQRKEPKEKVKAASEEPAPEGHEEQPSDAG